MNKLLNCSLTRLGVFLLLIGAMVTLLPPVALSQSVQGGGTGAAGEAGGAGAAGSGAAGTGTAAGAGPAGAGAAAGLSSTALIGIVAGAVAIGGVAAMAGGGGGGGGATTTSHHP